MINIIMKYINLYYKKLYNYFINSNIFLLCYLPFFENKYGLTDTYLVHIRVGWMEWIVYKYQYDIILDQYILAYITFLYMQCLFMWPFYYVYVIKNRYIINSIQPELYRVIFFQWFNLIFDIFVLIDVILLISFYVVWPMSALSHSLFYKVLTKSVFAWGIILLFFYYEFFLFLLAIFGAGYSWRQLLVILFQFSLLNISVYIIWIGYHKYYFMKLAVFVGFHCVHAFLVNGWNYWYTEFDFEIFWRLGPEMEGWVHIHEYYKVKEIMKEKIDKIFTYERNAYLERKRQRMEESEKKREERQRLRQEGKLNIFICIIEDILYGIWKVYWYFTYYDIELKKKMEKERKDKFIKDFQDTKFQEDLMDMYLHHVDPYYRAAAGNFANWNKVVDNLKQELKELSENEEMVTKFYNLFKQVKNISEKLIRIKLKQAFIMHMEYEVTDKRPMTFYEFIYSFEDKTSFIKNRKRLSDKYENVDEIMEEEDKKTYEELITIDATENLTFLRGHVRYITLLKKFPHLYERDKVLWDRIFAVIYAEAIDIFEKHNISRGINFEPLLKFKEDFLKELSRKFDDRDRIVEENDDNALSEEEFIESVDNFSETYSDFVTEDSLYYSWDTIIDNIDFLDEYEYQFMDYETEEEKREQDEFEQSLWTYTFLKWKEIEEEDDYFKYTNFQKFIWWYNILWHILGYYIFFWWLSYDDFWLSIPVPTAYAPLYGEAI